MYTEMTDFELAVYTKMIVWAKDPVRDYAIINPRTGDKMFNIFGATEVSLNELIDLYWADYFGE